jgi:hypothetical protein
MTEPVTPEALEETVEPTPMVEEAVQEAPASDNSEAEMDAVLDKLLGIDSPETTRETAAPEPATDAEYDKAIKALQRDGVPSDVIEGIKANPSKVKEWGLKAAKRQADVDSFGAKVAESKKTEQKPEASKPSASARTEDKESDADPLSEFKEIFGEEAAKPLADMQKRMEREMEAKAKSLELRYESQMAYQSIRSDYGRTAPSYDSIVEAAARIGRENPGKFDSVESIMREAFRSVAGAPRTGDVRNLAKPTVGSQVKRASARQVDKDDIALDILLSGGNRDDVRKVLSR